MMRKRSKQASEIEKITAKKSMRSQHFVLSKKIKLLRLNDHDEILITMDLPSSRELNDVTGDK